MSAFADLLDRLQPLEPRRGWALASDIRELSDEELGTVLAECDALTRNAGRGSLFVNILRMQLRSGAPPERRFALIGAAYVHELEQLARHYLVQELHARAAVDVDAEPKDWRDEAAEHAGVPRHGEIP